MPAQSDNNHNGGDAGDGSGRQVPPSQPGQQYRSTAQPSHHSPRDEGGNVGDRFPPSTRYRINNFGVAPSQLHLVDHTQPDTSNVNPSAFPNTGHSASTGHPNQSNYGQDRLLSFDPSKPMGLDRVRDRATTSINPSGVSENTSQQSGLNYGHPVPARLNHSQSVPAATGQNNAINNHNQPVPTRLNYGQPVPAGLNHGQSVPATTSQGNVVGNPGQPANAGTGHPYFCEDCNQGFGSEREKNRHLRYTEAHPEEPLFECSCGFKIRRRDNCQRHVRKMVEKGYHNHQLKE